MWMVTQRSLGGPEVLEVVRGDRPHPVVNEVVVRVRAAGVNPVDALLRSGFLRWLGEPPFTLGWDVSGEVVQVAPGVTRFSVGDEVFGMPCIPHPANGYAEFVSVPSRHLARKPAGLDHVRAAALPLAGLTAWQALVDTAGVGAGDRVLVHGGGGGVGHVAVQLAKSRGAEVVTTASLGKHEFVRGIGADEVIDYRAVDFGSVVAPVDVVLDTVGGATALRSLDVLRPGGLLITLVGMGDERLFARAAELGLRCSVLTAEPDHAGLAALADEVDAGRLRVHVAETVPLHDVARAHGLIDAGSGAGKIVLVMD
ncbi:NADP-dependent oxidoreductase [Saccharopolyspora sp. NPDC047091]|uniref:NADP-dependent oxidoreductase n=1 Tax=Saccharopolyspora sp. NPDC047091 TaxID=3155924 RepID=UPI0033E04924